MGIEALTTDPVSITPGPWQVENDGAWVSARDTPDDGGDIICNPPDSDCETSLARWPANARLIAAAPELLAALREIATECPYKQWADIARAGIAKAEGRS